MRIRYYYISVVILMICFFSLTACVPYHPMKITVDELTVDTDIYMLLKPNAEQLKEQSDDEFMKGTEIWNYNEFGWVSASLAVNEVHERRPDIYTSEYILEVGYKKADGADKVRDFCETFKEMRFAIVDKKGNIKNVSKTYSLIPEDKFGYPCEMIYNAKNDTLKITKYNERLFHGRTPSSWCGILVLFSWISDLVIFILLVISLVNQRVKFSNGERISLSLLSVPAMANIILALIIFLVPYLNVTTTPSLSSKMIEILESNFPFAVDIIMFFISLFVHHLHREKDNKFIK